MCTTVMTYGTEYHPRARRTGWDAISIAELVGSRRGVRCGFKRRGFVPASSVDPAGTAEFPVFFCARGTLLQDLGAHQQMCSDLQADVAATYWSGRLVLDWAVNVADITSNKRFLLQRSSTAATFVMSEELWTCKFRCMMFLRQGTGLMTLTLSVLWRRVSAISQSHQTHLRT